MIDPSVRFPGEVTLDWVVRGAGGVRVVGGRRMTGGLTSSVHRLTVADRAGSRRHVVLRRWVAVDLTRGRRRAAREARVLEALSGSGIPAPRLIDVSDGADTEGVPAVLMTRVPGHVFLTPSDPADWLKQVADVLPVVHGVGVSADTNRPDAWTRAWPTPDWIRDPAVWRGAQDVLMQPPPASPSCFIHTDFQHFNLLWQRERLTGIVDWNRPGIGSPDLDVGHCRLNLAVLHSVDWAERFRLAYESTAGRKVEPWFDLYRLTQFTSDWQRFIPLQVSGRAEVDIAGIPGRVEGLITSVLDRL
ncbi:MAG TPA: aminoglycoside phosphotransferase family protein [Acidimicrobiales bacterium]|nr:aminoglycoside phosphotransferase family protein [Acidimicrobiales bacterium]